MASMIDMGTVSARGQIALPAEMRKKLRISSGSKIIFAMEDDAIVMTPARPESLGVFLKPLHEMKKKIQENEVDSLIHKMRKNASRP